MPNGSNKLRVIRVTVEAPVTSFRYPHFLIGRQITYDMPPPSTIYGHVASAVGELPRRESFRFGYHFSFVARGSDLEHQHIINAGRSKFEAGGQKYPTNVHATVQPHTRDFLFRPVLSLYIDRLDFAEAFRSPAFCVILGRSQDLACVTEVSEVELDGRGTAYFERTLLPFSMRTRLPLGATVMMPRFIEPPPERRAHFDRFVALKERIYAGPINDAGQIGGGHRLLEVTEPNQWWVDPTTAEYHGAQRGIIFHSFV